MTKITVAVDAEGGDHAPDIVIQGARLSRERHPDVNFVFFGDETRVKKALDTLGDAPLREKSEIIHTSDRVAADAKPAVALRRGKETSMWKAITHLAEGKADSVISAGNTGALMAMSRLILKMIPGADRPAIAALWPTFTSETVVLDVGANIDASEKQLIDFAVMGAEYARILYQTNAPVVSLLNVGSEAPKGGEIVKAASAKLETLQDGAKFKYLGFVEGDDISKGVADVIVTDGFSGNIALKTAEGTARLIGSYLKGALTASLFGKIGAFIAGRSLRAFKQKIDPRRVNGGVFLGLNGLVVKSHGGTDGFGYAAALDLAIDLSKGKVTEAIKTNFARNFTPELTVARETPLPDMTAHPSDKAVIEAEERKS